LSPSGLLTKLELLLPHPVQRQYRLLGFGLHYDNLAGHLCGHPDCTRVCRVILITNVECLGELRRYQLDLMCHLYKCQAVWARR